MYSARTLAIAALLCAAGAAQAGQQALLEQLRVDHAALRAAERDFQRHREQGTLGSAEAADYAGYLSRLRERVAQDCIALAGTPLPPDLPCPAVPSSGAGPASIDQASEQTRGERTRSLDAELNSGLGEFDELLLREQERVKAAAVRADGGAGGDAGAGGEGGGGDAGEGGAGHTGQQAGAGEAADGSGQARAGGTMPGGDVQQGSGAMAGQSQSGARGGRTATSGVGGQPPGYPDGSDDDLVARQMREAAQKETDPELKKKLWEEYRKYKQGTR